MIPSTRSLFAAAAVLIAATLGFAGEATKPVKPARLAHGAEIKIEDLVVKGKTVIFDFTSEFCPPCRRIAPLLHALHEKRDDIVVIEIDINRPETRGIDWKSPVARQYALESVPHFKLFGPDGKKVAEGDAAYEKVIQMLQEAGILKEE